jgi:uncharacterized protein YyaL (SSP411 family)
MANRLAQESSPYLLQHAGNPVEWYPWGDEALNRAREEDRPLLVSIGYSACHWCHVMERESFEDHQIAELMNRHFVCIKVDREERPDVDAVCMEACQTMTGQGGWPLNAFLTPEQAPFYVGTYFPPEPRHGMPSWRMVLDAIIEAWEQRRDRVREQGDELLGALGGASRLQGAQEAITPAVLEQADAELLRRVDRTNGGFGSAPKFPQASLIEFLLARGDRRISLQTLRAMAAGGIYDQVGGGFARYAVDATWTVPHFEKMLYDNALLARAYLHGWQVSGDPLLRRVCEETLDWSLREMRSPDGGFYAALDADSEGVEGRYYVWTLDELRSALGELADCAIAFFGATAEGNFEATNVLEGRGPVPEHLTEIRARLYTVREQRVRPGLDDKQLTSWNALMIGALADAGAALQRPDYVDAAVACAQFLRERRRDESGRLLRTGGGSSERAAIPGFLEDHAYLLEALLTLYEATFDPCWFLWARELADTMIDRFADEENGGFFTTAAGDEQGFPRRKDLDDSPIPAAGSSSALGLLRLAAYTGEYEYERRAIGVLGMLAPIAGQHPVGFGHALQALHFHLAAVREVAIAGDGDELAQVVRGAYHPHIVLAGGSPAGVPLLQGREPVDGHAAAYVCEHFSCRAPVTTARELADAVS